jgi:hypothetical protein
MTTLEYEKCAEQAIALISKGNYESAKKIVSEARTQFDKYKKRIEQEIRDYEEIDRGTTGLAMGFFCQSERFNAIRALEKILENQGG